MANSRQLRVSMRNLYWAIAVGLAGVVVGLFAGWKAGVVAAAIVLILSEVVERFRRRKSNHASADADA